jgi:D-glycero-alpha-D-manno-heptose-7-phosphate kinase
VLIARAPLRISFAGGGTDIEAYYGRHGGMVVSATINKYFYVIITRTIDDAVQITSSDFRTFERTAPDRALTFDGELGYLKSILHEFGVTKGLSVFTSCEIPPGTGLGSSSTVAVALIKALATLSQRRASKQEIAELASYIEIVKLGRPIGLQDQFASSYGGLNFIEFEETGTTVQPLQLDLEQRDRLERSVLLFFTGSSRNAATILEEQSRDSARDVPRVLESLHGIKQDALEARDAIQKGRLRRLGEIMHRSWQRKKQLATGVSNERIDRLYQLALEHGAVGGKIAGAGGGGFLMLYCEPENQEAVTRVLEAEGLARLGFHFDDGGAQVLVNSVPDVPGLAYPEGRWIVTGVGSE